MMNERGNRRNGAGDHGKPREKGVDPLRMAIDPGTASSEEIAEPFIAMSVLHRSFGGEGLTFDVTGETDKGMSIVEIRPRTAPPLPKVD